MRYGEVLPLLRVKVVAPVRVEGERHLVARLAVRGDLVGDGLLQLLGTGKTQGPVHKVVLVVHHHEQTFHDPVPPLHLAVIIGLERRTVPAVQPTGAAGSVKGSASWRASWSKSQRYSCCTRSYNAATGRHARCTTAMTSS